MSLRLFNGRRKKKRRKVWCYGGGYMSFSLGMFSTFSNYSLHYFRRNIYYTGLTYNEEERATHSVAIHQKKNWPILQKYKWLEQFSHCWYCLSKETEEMKWWKASALNRKPKNCDTGCSQVIATIFFFYLIWTKTFLRPRYVISREPHKNEIFSKKKKRNQYEEVPWTLIFPIVKVN